MVADASMASVVGYKRAWSRAMLWKIRNQSRRHGLLAKKSNSHANRLRKSKVVKPKIAKTENFDQASELRKLVPGGEAMEYSNLLEETAHYIKCLTTQVGIFDELVKGEIVDI
ncbi:hypothetical protein RJ641_031400 [Dillenia turbinata]|uniref:BHLH domain-containing protein n=1 Tax=Dillenia turbinata TaxID=194707 RepID=A0AAN8ZHF2_9MAGN